MNSSFDLITTAHDVDPVDLYERAQSRSDDARPAVYTNGDVHVAAPGDHLAGYGEPEVLHRNPVGFAHALTQTAMSAPLYDTTDDDGTVHTFGHGLLVDGHNADVNDYILRNLPDHMLEDEHGLRFTGIRGHDGEYIDGWSAHKGMIFRPHEYEFAASTFVSEPMALANPGEHLSQIAREPDATTRLLDADHARSAGWSEHDPIGPNERGEFRDRMDGLGYAVVYFDSDSYVDPWLPLLHPKAELA